MPKLGKGRDRWFLALAGTAILLLGSLGAGLTGASAQDDLALASAVTQARETCYAAADCPNLDALAGLFAENARRTEIQRNNSVVLVEGADALRADHQRGASSFTGRKVETTAMLGWGRNVVALQRNWDPGAAEPNPFISIFRIEDGRVAHWILIAP